MKTATIRGVEAVPVDVEVDVGPGLPSFSIVGLPDLAVQEARERVRSAMRACDFEVPNARIVVNLAPGPLRKHGTGFDLPIAIGLLVATGQLPAKVADSVVAVGELSLLGGLREVPGMIAYGLHAMRSGLPLLAPSCRGAVTLDGLDVLQISRLSQLKNGLPAPTRTRPRADRSAVPDIDFSDVCGQDLTIRALTVAAAGGHNVLLVGPPGSGKTMLARRQATILSPLSRTEAVETAVVHSVAGFADEHILAGNRPFRAPHHSASIAGLVGGGTPVRPGEVSLAHNGVLFLDEMPEFGPASLQSLRQPLEDGVVTLVRADGRLAFPARFTLIGAANPCPCGHLGDTHKTCSCPAGVVERYQARIGGPLMDRIDVVARVERPDPSRLTSCKGGPASRTLYEQVCEAHLRARGRGETGGLATGAALLGSCAMDSRAQTFLENSARRHHLSGRGITRVLRVARTIADLDGHDGVDANHLAEALGYRQAGAA